MRSLSRILQAGAQSGTIMCVADIATQLLVEQRKIQNVVPRSQHLSDDGDAAMLAVGESYDPARTCRWAVAGLTLHGPYFFVGFSRLDQYFGAATTLSTVLKKTAAAQFVLFPPYLVLLFSYLGLMEGVEDIKQKVQARVPEAFLGGCFFWPIANGVNFAIVPPALRVPYVATSAGMWNSYLSWTNARVKTLPGGGDGSRAQIAAP